MYLHLIPPFGKCIVVAEHNYSLLESIVGGCYCNRTQKMQLYQQALLECFVRTDTSQTKWDEVQFI
jgi:hypothetical protein